MKFLAHARPPMTGPLTANMPRFTPKMNALKLDTMETSNNGQSAKINKQESPLANAFLAAALVVPLAFNIQAYTVQPDQINTGNGQQSVVQRGFKTRGQIIV